MAKELTLEDLRAQADELRAAWSKIPVAEILNAATKDLQSDATRALTDNLRPLFDALPAEEPAKQHLGNLIGILTNLPTVLTQRVEALARS